MAVLNKICTFASDFDLPKWKTFQKPKMKKLSKTDNDEQIIIHQK